MRSTNGTTQGVELYAMLSYPFNDVTLKNERQVMILGSW